MKIIASALVLMTALSASAKDIKLTSKAARKTYIQKATVWQTPPQGLTANDIFNGPDVKGYAKLLQNERVYCQTTEEDQTGDFGGATPKFYCQLLKPLSGNRFEYIVKDDGERRVVKVKYNPPGRQNREIQGELIGTRLLWALGFYADQMFFVDEVYCYGCTKHPFKTRRVVSDNPKAGNIFKDTAIEKKLSGDKVMSEHRVSDAQRQRDPLAPDKVWSAGVEFKEMMANLPEVGRAEQVAQRDALRLLAIFMNHIDLKSDNQRMICTKTNDNDQCTKAIMMIQDVGTSFGVTLSKQALRLKKVDLQTWRSTPIWQDPARCMGLLTKNPAAPLFVPDWSMLTPKISDAGRVFLAKLLTDFSSDRSRVEALFRAGRVDDRELSGWVDAFISKVNQIRFPLGSATADFRCPTDSHN